MKKTLSWLVIIFMIMFWLFRLVVTYMASMGMETPYEPFDMVTEIVVLFISFFSIILVMNRKILGGILYAVSYVYYFGASALNGIVNLTTTSDMANTVLNSGSQIFMSVVAIMLVIFAVLDLLLNKDRHEGKDNKNTYWFYKNKKYERKLDERADKNEYRIK